MRTYDKRQPTVLLTGFEPFGGDDINPSWEAVHALDDHEIAGHRVLARRLPTSFAGSLPALRRALREADPALAIAVGLAGGREGISLERVAINLIDARIPDTAGAQPIDVKVARAGPAAYFSTLPIKATLLALQQADISAHISQTAGTFVCNQVFYALLHALRRRRGVRAGFVHVPWLPAQAARHRQPGMALADTCRALEIIVETALATRDDLRVAGGTVA